MIASEVSLDYDITQIALQLYKISQSVNNPISKLEN